jgi:hypothetical protein
MKALPSGFDKSISPVWLTLNPYSADSCASTAKFSLAVVSTSLSFDLALIFVFAASLRISSTSHADKTKSRKRDIIINCFNVLLLIKTFFKDSF